MIDASHGNSRKKHQNQPEVVHQVVQQFTRGNHTIIGVMAESNLKAGNQPYPSPKSELIYGTSITDACMDWTTTETLIRTTYENLARVEA